MPLLPYQLEFYEDASGDSPVERWLESLSPVEAYALGSAMDGLLQQPDHRFATVSGKQPSTFGSPVFGSETRWSRALLSDAGRGILGPVFSLSPVE
jgi:hypothetical protein